MYEEFYGLREKPFNLVPDPQYLYLGKSHQEALNHLLYGIDQREGFMVITGEIGVGKTTICRSLLERLEPKVQSALILNPILSEAELLRTILEEFKAISTRRGSAKGLTRKDLITRLNQFLLRIAAQGHHAVLIIDEAQNLSLSVLEQIRLLSNLETHKEKLLQIILVGQVELSHKLALPELAQLNQRVSIRYHMEPLLEAEVERYIDHRLNLAGAHGGIVFSKKALKAIFRYSRGIPRLINLACDRALLAGFEVASTVITQQLVKRGLTSLGGESPDRKEARRAYVAVILVLLGVIAALAYENPTLTRVLGGLKPTQAHRSLPPPAAQAVLAEPNIPAAEGPAAASKEALQGLYTIYIDSYQGAEASRARHTVDLLGSLGYTAYTSTVELPDQGVWHRVLAGEFDDQEEATRMLLALKALGEFPYARVVRK